MSTSSRPHIILIPGAMHDGSCFDRLEPRLRAAGYQTTALTLPSVGAEPPLTTIDKDIDCVRSAITPLLDAGQDVLVVMHSYGGLVGTTSLSGLAKRDRIAHDLPGGVTSLVYLCAWMLDAGQNISAMGGGRGGKLGPSAISVQGNYLRHLKPIEAFYHDIPREEAEDYASRLVHHSGPTMAAEVAYAAWRDIPTTYLLGNGDITIAPEKQWKCINQAREAGVKIDVVECESGHSPFLSMPELCSKVIRRAAGENIDI